ncbi:DUF4244 domain-containing protein [Luteimicrobium sp. DT211]|uniref:DUF4244 domain-containing protein n=1 Tax=Luteimicrobium sp. DT211 TaxID=3393412 RepID=UPI003CE6AD2D
MHALDTPSALRSPAAPPHARSAAGRARTVGRALARLVTTVRAWFGRARHRLVGPAAPGGGPAAAREAGMATAEYAIATLAAVGFAGLLLVILKSAEVRGLLLGIIKSALSVG